MCIYKNPQGDLRIVLIPSQGIMTGQFYILSMGKDINGAIKKRICCSFY